LGPSRARASRTATRAASPTRSCACAACCEPKRAPRPRHWPEPLSLALAADERAVVVEVWDHDAKGSEALGHVELDLRARPSGGPEAFKLQGNAAEVNADSTITLTWAVTSDGGAGGAPAAGGQAKRPNEAAAGTAAGGRPAVQGRHGDGEGAAPPPPPP
jgi:hypothetical protein